MISARLVGPMTVTDLMGATRGKLNLMRRSLGLLNRGSDPVAPSASNALGSSYVPFRAGSTITRPRHRGTAIIPIFEDLLCARH